MPVLVTVVTNAGFNQANLYAQLNGATVVSSASPPSSTSYRIINTTLGLEIQFVGSGFTYGSGGAITGGTVSAINIFDLSNNALLTSTGYSLSASALYAAIETARQSSNELPLDALFKTIDYDLNGAAGPDGLRGGNLNDIFKGGAGDDTFIGGGGGDLAIYAGSAPITVDMAAGIVTGDASIGTDTLRSIERITGTNAADTYSAVGLNSSSLNAGSLELNEFEGRGGDDTITGNGSTRLSYLSATAGVTFSIATGTASGDASVGTDTFSGVNQARGSGHADTLNGSNGTPGTFEGFEGRGGDDTINGGGGFDRAIYTLEMAGVTINLAAGTTSGGGGNDTLRRIEAVRGSELADSYNAMGFGSGSINAGDQGTGNEFEGGGGNDTIIGNGNTKLSYFSATAGVTVNITTGVASGMTVGTDTFSGVNDVLGSNFNDTLLGSVTTTFENFAGRAGNDFIDGNGGFDRALYNTETGPISVAMAAGVVTAPSGVDTLRRVEGVEGTNFADGYDGRGFGANSVNAGSLGLTNEFEGLGGNDTILGNGQTRVAYSKSTGAVNVNFGTGRATGDASVGSDNFKGVNAVVGSNFDDVFNGSDNPLGTFENFDGRGGNDKINGNGGFDRAVYRLETTAINVSLALGQVTVGATGDTLRGVEAVQGSNLADVYNATGFNGSSRNAGNNGTFNEFEGMGGDDSIIGNGNTRVAFTSATAGVTVDTAAGVASGDSSVGNDTFSGVSQVRGSSFADDLSGRDSVGTFFETFEGRGGADFIDGRGGLDRAMYFQETSGIAVDLADGVVVVGSESDTLRSIEMVQGSDYADVFVATGFGAGSINGGSAGTLNEFEGLAGADRITGNGNTRLSYLSATASIDANMATGRVQGNTSVGLDRFTGVNHIIGSQFDDEFIGSDTVPFVREFFEGRGGDDSIFGAGGFDVAVYLAESAAISVDMASGVVSGGGGNDTLRNVEGVQGTNFADSYNAVGFATTSVNASSVGTSNDFEGMGGNDSIVGNGFTRLSYASATAAVTVNFATGAGQGNGSVGSDTFSGVNQVTGSAFVDDLIGSNMSANFEAFQGLGGNDRINGAGGFDRAIYRQEEAGIFVKLANGRAVAASGTDQLRAVEAIMGSNFDDTYDAVGFASNSLNAGSFGTFNEIEALGGDDTIFGNGDTKIAFYNATSGVMVDISMGQASGDASVGSDTFSGVNQVRGSNFADTLIGSNNTARFEAFEGSGGIDTIDGRGGFDRVIYNQETDRIVVRLADGIVNALSGKDFLQGIEAVQGTNFADSFSAVGFGSTSTNAGSLNMTNEFEGLAGNDTITGNGSTRISYFSAGAAVSVNIAAGRTQGDGSVGRDTFSGVNQVVGSNFADTFVGSNTTTGFESFEGRGGADMINGAGGFDRAIYTNDGPISVNLAAGTVNLSSGNDTLSSVEAVRGSNFADTFTAVGFSASSVNAGSQNTLNEFEGLGGNDNITGNGNTRLAFTQASGGVNVDLAAGVASGNGSVGTDMFTGVAHVIGSEFADVIVGNAAVNFIDARGGADDISGGGGNDTFVFGNIIGADVVQDYVAGADKFDLASVSGLDVYADVRALMTEDSGDVLITLSAGNVIAIKNTTFAVLDANQSDFLL